MRWYRVPPGMTPRILCTTKRARFLFNGWSWNCFLTDIPWQWCFAEIATAITLGTTTAIISLHELHFPGLQIWRSVGAAAAINHVASCTFPDCRFIKVSTPSIDLKISCLLNKELCYMYRFFVLVYWQKNWQMLVSKDKLCDHDLVVITYISMDSFVLVYYRCCSWKTNFVTTILWWSHTYPWILLYYLYCSSNVQRQNMWPPSLITIYLHLDIVCVSSQWCPRVLYLFWDCGENSTTIPAALLNIVLFCPVPAKPKQKTDNNWVSS